MTRRELLALAGGGAALALAGSPARLAARDASEKLSAFPLQDVRLLEGPFLDAQRRDFDYLSRCSPIGCSTTSA